MQLDLDKWPDCAGDEVDVTLDDARHLVALEHGFANWTALQAFTRSPSPAARVAAKPVRLVRPDDASSGRAIAISRDWDEIIRLLASYPAAALNAEGQMTDAVLADVSRVETVTALKVPARTERCRWASPKRGPAIVRCDRLEFLPALEVRLGSPPRSTDPGRRRSRRPFRS